MLGHAIYKLVKMIYSVASNIFLSFMNCQETSDCELNEMKTYSINIIIL